MDKYGTQPLGVEVVPTSPQMGQVLWELSFSRSAFQLLQLAADVATQQVDPCHVCFKYLGKSPMTGNTSSHGQHMIVCH